MTTNRRFGGGARRPRRAAMVLLALAAIAVARGVQADPGGGSSPDAAAPAHDPRGLGTLGWIDRVTDFQAKERGAWIEQAGGRDYAVSVVDAPVRWGKAAVRFEHRASDMALPHRGERSEILLLEHEENGQAYWHGVSLLIPEGSAWARTSKATRIFQWHAFADSHLGERSRSPVLEFTVDRGKFRITCASDPTQLTIDNQVVRERLYEQPTPLEEGVWHDFVVHVKWGYDGDGFVRVWMNGRQIVDYTGGVGYRDRLGPYFKMGIYRRSDPGGNDAVIYHDEYRRGSTREAVDIRMIEEAAR